MLQMLQNPAKFQNFQLDNLVDCEKRCKTRIFLQRSVSIQPKTSEILPKICRSANYPDERFNELQEELAAESQTNIDFEESSRQSFERLDSQVPRRGGRAR